MVQILSPEEEMVQDLIKTQTTAFYADHVEAKYPVKVVPLANVLDLANKLRARDMGALAVRDEDGKEPKEYRKIAHVVRAIRYDGTNVSDIEAFMGGPKVARITQTRIPGPGRGLVPGITIWTLNGPVKVPEGEWIIEGIKGEYYPCRDDIFRESYENLR